MIKKILILTTFITLFFPIKSKANNYEYCNSYDLKFLFKKIYNVELCAEDKKMLNYKNIYNQNFILTIKYNINFTKKELVESSLSEIIRYNKINDTKQEAYSRILQNLFPSVQKNDIISAIYNKNGNLQFYYNNKNYSSTKDKDFNRDFLNIWLHKDNKYKKMTQKLYENRF
ncbi:chalcone isomerase family protein [Rickettsiales bacterium]|nr:chalcone isomerase family protein [Rickettsiales bacterium]